MRSQRTVTSADGDVGTRNTTTVEGTVEQARGLIRAHIRSSRIEVSNDKPVSVNGARSDTREVVAIGRWQCLTARAFGVPVG